MKTCLKPLVIHKMQIRTTMITLTLKRQMTPSVGEEDERRQFSEDCWWEYKEVECCFGDLALSPNVKVHIPPPIIPPLRRYAKERLLC